MEKQYKLIEVENNPFEEHLYQVAVSEGKTDLDRESFDLNIALYKILKESNYLGNNKIEVEISGTTEIITQEEAKLLTESMENKLKDIQEALKEVRDQLKIEKEAPKTNKIVVYTCITGGYDNLIKPSIVTPGVDYVCFTDNPELKSNIWKIRPIPEELLGYSKVKQQRGVKILPHRYLPEYDISIWIDANVDTKGNLNEYLKGLDFTKYSVFIPEHPARKCIYKEKAECLRQKKITGEGVALAEKQMERYRNEKFPENYGLVQSNIIVRKHNDEYSKKVMEKWWEELKDYSHRDQLSFNYALWKVGNERFKYLIKTTCNSRTFKWAIAHRRK